jgi:mannose-6-phosphate isomerase-like protein (cupin superfamily)
MAGSLAHSDRPAAVRRLLDALAETLRVAAASEASAAAPLTDFARRVRAIGTEGPAAPAPPERLAVCRVWDDALRAAPGALAGPVAALGPWLSWTQNPNYRRRPPDPTFLDNYGYAVIAGPADGPPALVSAPDVALGVLLLGPGAYYPLHAHPAVEVYVTLTPDGEWWRGDGPWRREPPGAAIYHAPGVPHAMRAGSAPLLALYVWRGDLATYARITSPSLPTRRSSPGRAGARPGGRRARGTRGPAHRRGRRPGRP